MIKSDQCKMKTDSDCIYIIPIMDDVNINDVLN